MSNPPPNAPATLAGPPDESALVARLKVGDRAAFTALVGSHGGALLRLATTFLRDRSVAEEVVQDTWLAALDGLDGFEGRASLRTWLFSILANRARNRAVREGRSLPFSALGEAVEGPAVDPSRFQPDGHWIETHAGWTEEDPERLAAGAETRAAIEAAIAALPDAMRAVVTLRDVEGLEAEEICNLLGLSLTNQRVLLHRARCRLRQALADLQQGAR
jgi:RNA polymerase sigma-70 factor (ECF subfamily)